LGQLPCLIIEVRERKVGAVLRFVAIIDSSVILSAEFSLAKIYSIIASVSKY
jgi:hypothetical protein